jgi:ketosteroid isomerase-like protein
VVKWFAGVVTPMMQLLADDVVYHLPGNYLGGGDIVGFEELLARGRRYASTFDRPSRTEVLEVIGDDHFVVTTERHMAARSGESLDHIVCGVWRMVGERAVELWAHHSNPAALARLWPAPEGASTG